MCVLSCVRLFVAPWTVAHQDPLSMEFSRQEYWSGLPFPTPVDLPNPGSETPSLVSPALVGGFFTSRATWEAHIFNRVVKKKKWQTWKEKIILKKIKIKKMKEVVRSEKYTEISNFINLKQSATFLLYLLM